MSTGGGKKWLVRLGGLAGAAALVLLAQCAGWLANQLHSPNLYDFLRTAGIARLRPETQYGLAWYWAAAS